MPQERACGSLKSTTSELPSDAPGVVEKRKGRDMWRPSYWSFRGRPLKVIATEDGGTDILWLNTTLEWERYLTAWADIVGGDPDADQLTEEDFERWVAGLNAGFSQDEAWEAALAESTSLLEGVVEATDGTGLLLRGKWWRSEGGLLASVRVGDWVRLRLTPEEAIITELRPAPR